MLYPCTNYDVCHTAVDQPGKLCDSCKQAAKQLEREIRENERLERMRYVSKNSGLRRHGKAGR